MDGRTRGHSVVERIVQPVPTVTDGALISSTIAVHKASVAGTDARGVIAVTSIGAGSVLSRPIQRLHKVQLTHSAMSHNAKDMTIQTVGCGHLNRNL